MFFFGATSALKNCIYWHLTNQSVFFLAAYVLTSNILTPSTTWDVVNVESDQLKTYRGQNFSSLFFAVHLKRKSAFYVANVIAPSIAINYLSLFNFVIPAESGEKISYGVTIFLAQTVNMMMISNSMPQGASSIPLLGQYLVFSILFIATCLLVTIFMVSGYIDPMSNHSKVGKALRFVLERIRPIMGPKNPKRDVLTDKKVEETTLNNNSVNLDDNARNDDKIEQKAGSSSEETSLDGLTQQEQVVIAYATMNRVFFVISFLLMTFLTAIYMIILSANSDSKIQGG